MLLNKLLENVPVLEEQNQLNHEISCLAYKPEDVQEGCLYFAINEFIYHDGKLYDSGTLLNEDVAVKIKCIVHQEALATTFADISSIHVSDSRKAMSVISSNFYGNPEQCLTLLGVTGTNGKTTTANLIRHFLDSNGKKTAVIGTLGAKWQGKEIVPGFTTPLAPELYAIFRDMADDGVTHCVMEVSSHSLELDRVYGLKFPVKVFTNLTRDHIDFHGNFEGYKAAKMRLFRESGNNEVAICNHDDPVSMEIAASFKGKSISYGFLEGADCHVTSYALENFESLIPFAFEGESFLLKSRLLSRFNAMNIIAAYLAALNMSLRHEEIANALLSFDTVPGRFEKIVALQGYLVIIDYAHTPDAVENIVKSCRDLTKERLITVFGCGGDRDRGKRPMMGDIALKYSDFAVVTSDNPRTESPQQILSDIIVNYPKGASNYSVIEDRKEAIFSALQMAGKGDVVVIAGKGHEDYQIIGRETIHFSDRETVEEFLER